MIKNTDQKTEVKSTLDQLSRILDFDPKIKLI